MRWWWWQPQWWFKRRSFQTFIMKWNLSHNWSCRAPTLKTRNQYLKFLMGSTTNSSWDIEFHEFSPTLLVRLFVFLLGYFKFLIGYTRIVKFPNSTNFPQHCLLDCLYFGFKFWIGYSKNIKLIKFYVRSFIGFFVFVLRYFDFYISSSSIITYDTLSVVVECWRSFWSDFQSGSRVLKRCYRPILMYSYDIQCVSMHRNH